ncbi:hypothetical protein RCH14_001384 [Massilia sp. MP_M2]
MVRAYHVDNGLGQCYTWYSTNSYTNTTVIYPIRLNVLRDCLVKTCLHLVMLKKRPE